MEEWRVITEFPNYDVSNLGNIRNNKTNKLLKPCIKGGYSNISLKNGPIKKSLKIHRVVALSFIPNPENKPYVDHKNNIRDDNRIDNLRWATIKENKIIILDFALLFYTFFYFKCRLSFLLS